MTYQSTIRENAEARYGAAMLALCIREKHVAGVPHNSDKKLYEGSGRHIAETTKRVFSTLNDTPKSTGDIAAETGIPAGNVATAMGSLLRIGICRNVSELKKKGRWVRGPRWEESRDKYGTSP